MAITSYNVLLGNWTASAAYVAACGQIEKQIDEWFNRYSDKAIEEPGILGLVVALRGALSTAGRSNELCVSTKKVERWKQQYQAWHEGHGSSIKVQRGIDRKKLLDLAIEEFDSLIAVIRSYFKKPSTSYNEQENS